LTCYISPLFDKQGLGEIFGKLKANLKSPLPPLRKGEANAKSPFFKGRSIVPLFGKEGLGEIFEKSNQKLT